ncbi:IclR family transcriptional regulator [Nisaea sp.]|uniref:IclR family transcriptional regulator n=1 Tax=Nisaea sp. TaxID=2024842 RepID=UPI003B51B655
MTSGVKGAQSFSRSLGVLQIVADSDGEADIGRLQEATGLTRPTLYRILASLEAEGLLVRRPGKQWELGARLVALARKALAESDIRTLARAHLEALRDRTGETVHLALRSGDELVYVDKIESRQLVRMSSEIGTRVTFYSSGVGKAFLSALAPPASERIIGALEPRPMTRFTNTDKDVLREVVSAARRKGYVVDAQENEEGIVCFGAPICAAEDRPVASVSVSVPLFRLKDDPNHYSVPLVACTRSISDAVWGLY